MGLQIQLLNASLLVAKMGRWSSDECGFHMHHLSGYLLTYTKQSLAYGGGGGGAQPDAKETIYFILFIKMISHFHVLKFILKKKRS